jgi:TolA-binding protein
MMSCDTCQEHLLDLLYEEVEGEDADALRAHVDGCDECRASLEKLGMAQRLATELPMLEAPTVVTAAIMDAARAKVGTAAPAAEEVQQRVEEEDEGIWARFLRWAASFAMGPQVAMATIMLLVVSIGLWYFPNRQRGPEATGSTVMTPDDQGEVGPSATLSPADPLDLDLDERAGRIRTRDGEEVGDAPLARQAQRPATGAAIPAADPPREGASAGDDDFGAVVDGRLEEDRESPNVELQRDEARRNQNVDSLAALAQEGSLGGGRSSSTSSGVASNASPRPAPRQQQGAPATATSTAERERAPAQAPAAGAVAEQPPADAREAYARGMQRYQQGNFWGAVEDFNRVTRNPDGQESLVPSALHHLARSYRRANRCNLAAPQYRSLMSRFPRYSGTPRAMIELADCYRQLGRLSDARATLEQAQRHASVAAEARRQLLHIQQMERAARRMDRMEADEAAAEAAY